MRVGVLLLGVVEEKGNALAQLAANAFIVCFKVVGAKFRATECGFQSVDIVDLEVLPNSDSRSAFFILLHIEATVLVFVGLVEFFHEERKLFRPCKRLSFLSNATTIKEDMFFAGMAMHIDIHDDTAFPIEAANEFTHVIHFWLLSLLTAAPFPVQVTTKTRKSIIASCYAIGVEHWHYLQQILSSQHPPELVIPN